MYNRDCLLHAKVFLQNQVVHILTNLFKENLARRTIIYRLIWIVKMLFQYLLQSVMEYFIAEAKLSNIIWSSNKESWNSHGIIQQTILILLIMETTHNQLV